MARRRVARKAIDALPATRSLVVRRVRLRWRRSASIPSSTARRTQSLPRPILLHGSPGDAFHRRASPARARFQSREARQRPDLESRLVPCHLYRQRRRTHASGQLFARRLSLLGRSLAWSPARHEQAVQIIRPGSHAFLDRPSKREFSNLQYVLESDTFAPEEQRRQRVPALRNGRPHGAESRSSPQLLTRRYRS